MALGGLKVMVPQQAHCQCLPPDDGVLTPRHGATSATPSSSSSTSSSSSSTSPASTTAASSAPSATAAASPSPVVGVVGSSATSGSSTSAITYDAPPTFFNPPPFLKPIKEVGLIQLILVTPGVAPASNTTCPPGHAHAPCPRDQSYNLRGRPWVTIGRSHDACVRLQHPTASRAHAGLMHCADGTLYLIDMGSAHGTSTGGCKAQPVRPQVPTPIPSGTLLRFGDKSAPLYLVKYCTKQDLLGSALHRQATHQQLQLPFMPARADQSQSMNINNNSSNNINNNSQHHLSLNLNLNQYHPRGAQPKPAALTIGVGGDGGGGGVGVDDQAPPHPQPGSPPSLPALDHHPNPQQSRCHPHSPRTADEDELLDHDQPPPPGAPGDRGDRMSDSSSDDEEELIDPLTPHTMINTQLNAVLPSFIDSRSHRHLTVASPMKRTLEREPAPSSSFEAPKTHETTTDAGLKGAGAGAGAGWHQRGLAGPACGAGGGGGGRGGNKRVCFHRLNESSPGGAETGAGTGPECEAQGR